MSLLLNNRALSKSFRKAALSFKLRFIFTLLKEKKILKKRLTVLIKINDLLFISRDITYFNYF